MTQTFKQNWNEFCDELKSIGDIVSSQDNLTKTDEVEGYRYLTRLLRLSLEMNIEHSNKYHPLFIVCPMRQQKLVRTIPTTYT